MSDTVRLYFRYLGVAIRSRMQYRANVIMMATSHFLGTGIEIVTILVLFQRFGNLRGWTLAEVALFFGLVNIAFSISDAVGRGFDLFSQMLKSGDFDRVLLRPRSPVLQVAGQDFVPYRIGRFLQAAIVLGWAASSLHVTWTAAKLAFAAAVIAGGACFFVGLLVLQATLTFWTIEQMEVFNILTHGGVQCAQYPLGIYRRWFRIFFTAIIPLAFVAYFPGLALVGRSGGVPVPVQWLGPLAGPAFLMACLQVFKIGVRHYRSTGS